MAVKVDIQGIEEAARFLKLKKAAVKGLGLPLGLNNAALLLQGEVKESIAGRKAEPASVDTGRLLNSVDFRVGKEDATVFSDVGYSKFIEFGTSRFNARKHFRNSKERNKQKLAEVIDKAIKQTI